MCFCVVTFRGLSATVRGFAGLLIAASLALTMVSPARAADPWPAHVAAQYAIIFNGFDLGSFRFRADVKDGTYALNGDAEISALLGTFKWRGVTKAEGRVGAGPKPSDYIFAFNANSRAGSIKLDFDGKGPKSVSIVPPMPDHADTVPLKPQHLSGALDPLSAVMALTRPQSGEPCAQKLAVFDGKQRFDLQLSKRRVERIGTGETVVVCGVRYLPIGGYRQNAETQRMAASGDIEVTLRRVAGANINIPHEISIPTIAGTVRLVAKAVDVAMTPPVQKLALAR
ncbi:MAG: DUF3108 domain-containing protein [Hyphomicrobiaceae bacterium]|nr:DUF3108 domain-containing protein [Hyphomicrobiaceae bacterium]